MARRWITASYYIIAAACGAFWGGLAALVGLSAPWCVGVGVFAFCVALGWFGLCCAPKRGEG